MYPFQINADMRSLEYCEEVKSLVEESKSFLLNHSWCKKIKEGWLFTNLGSVLCIFLYRIINIQSPDDNLLWVIVGDLPPMYLDTFHVLNNKEAIEAYIELVNDWVDHVEAGQSLEKCYPLTADVSSETIQKLKKRIELLKSLVLPNLIGIPYARVNEL